MSLYLSPLTFLVSDVGRHVLSLNRSLLFFSPLWITFGWDLLQSCLTLNLRAVCFSVSGLRCFVFFTHRVYHLCAFIIFMRCHSL